MLGAVLMVEDRINILIMKIIYVAKMAVLNGDSFCHRKLGKLSHDYIFKTEFFEGGTKTGKSNSKIENTLVYHSQNQLNKIIIFWQCNSTIAKRGIYTLLNTSYLHFNGCFANKGSGRASGSLEIFGYE